MNVKTERIVLFAEIVVFVCLAAFTGYFEGFGGALLCGVSVLCALMVLLLLPKTMKPEAEKLVLDTFCVLFSLWFLVAVVSLIADRFAFNENYISIPLLILGLVIFRKKIFGIFKLFSSSSEN